MQVVWFKRDLRVHDHAALSGAASSGQLLPLYILEPELWQQPDMSRRHYLFLQECLTSLNAALTNLGQPLVVRVGDALSVLRDLHQEFTLSRLWSHQETGNAWTFQRDCEVEKWCCENDIDWLQPPQNGVVRRLWSRDSWSRHWYQFMNSTREKAPNSLDLVLSDTDELPTCAALGLDDDACLSRQVGGRQLAVELLQSFLKQRGVRYTKEMSSPVSAWESCSRLSTHLAFGSLSLREVWQALQKRQDLIDILPIQNKGYWSRSYQSFASRLRWHCHFIQKLEDEPRIEFENLHTAYNDVRAEEFNEDYFLAWKEGKTGYPLIDACMRALITTGWINFRMRAMLMSFASYHLWLHWRRPAVYLATLFTDYEPGIHYNQVQMQSGTTGINAIRIYNPIKQSIDQDPKGDFIRRWVPELSHLSEEFIHCPWFMTKPPENYPEPIVDEKTARRRAADVLYQKKKSLAHKEEANRIVEKHASRKRLKKKLPKRSRTKSQGELDL